MVPALKELFRTLQVPGLYNFLIWRYYTAKRSTVCSVRLGKEHKRESNETYPVQYLIVLAIFETFASLFSNVLQIFYMNSSNIISFGCLAKDTKTGYPLT